MVVPYLAQSVLKRPASWQLRGLLPQILAGREDMYMLQCCAQVLQSCQLSLYGVCASQGVDLLLAGTVVILVYFLLK